MIDIDKGKETVDKADNFFDRLNAFIRKHPIWFVIIILSALAWWMSTLPDEQYYEQPDEQYYEGSSDY